ncbi:MAG: hypothetical protein A2Y38_07680 [Spirochaetes bacterium GWB1_59_5]|nr:MAG: hypothetical protein A2Y38_07680 [Spirochaetes bacterium GWB1_59_5]
MTDKGLETMTRDELLAVATAERARREQLEDEMHRGRETAAARESETRIATLVLAKLRHALAVEMGPPGAA